MLARLVRELPAGPLTSEPKWDGFRCLAFVDEDGVDLRSRHDRPLARYFPELVDALAALRGPGGRDELALDGEILLASTVDATWASDPSLAADGFAALMRRLHPAASMVTRLRTEAPAAFVAFDVLARGDLDLQDRPYIERRGILEAAIPAAGVVSVTPATRSPDEAEAWLAGSRPGGDGVVVKPDDLRYEPGRRAMTKVKRLRTADCVVAGFRLTGEGDVRSLLLGLYADDGTLRHVGVVIQLGRTMRRTLLDELRPLLVPLARHPWRDGFPIGASPLGRLPGSAARWTPDMALDWLPVRPERVVEVGWDQVDGDRFRHPARFQRWRPDRTPDSCRLDQILPVGARDARAPLGAADRVAADRG